MTEFYYREFEVLHSPGFSKTKKVLRPIIPVILICGKIIVGYEALIDSGADYNIFDAEVADILGIKLTIGSKRQLVGLGGRITGYEHRVKLKIGEHNYEESVIFSKEIPVNSFGVLGNQGFFDHFDVNFNLKKKKIILNASTRVLKKAN